MQLDVFSYVSREQRVPHDHAPCVICDRTFSEDSCRNVFCFTNNRIITKRPRLSCLAIRDRSFPESL
jgi:hypothetical protein